jgi:hypothetical protein
MYCITITYSLGRDISVSIVTHYRMDSPGNESLWGGEIFHTLPDGPWGPPRPQYIGYWVFPWGEVAEAWH